MCSTNAHAKTGSHGHPATDIAVDPATYTKLTEAWSNMHAHKQVNQELWRHASELEPWHTTPLTANAVCPGMESPSSINNIGAVRHAEPLRPQQGPLLHLLDVHEQVAGPVLQLLGAVQCL